MHTYKTASDYMIEDSSNSCFMKYILSLRHHGKAVVLQALCISAFSIVLAASAPQALACTGFMSPRFNPIQMLLPTVADRMDHWNNEYDLIKDEALLILLPNDAKVNILSDKDNPAIERLEGDKRLQGVLNQPGYSWWSFRAVKQGSSSINIDSRSQKKTLVVNVRPTPRMINIPPAPRTIGLGQASREQPFSLSEGAVVEITLPGELKEGWSANDTSESGVKLKNMEQLPAADGENLSQIRLTFSVTGRERVEEPYHLMIKRGGLFSGESFHFYIRIIPARKC